LSDLFEAAANIAEPAAMAPCGPGCRFASPLAGWPEFVWCARSGAPHVTTHYDVDCPDFSPREGSAGPPAPVTLHENF